MVSFYVIQNVLDIDTIIYTSVQKLNKKKNKKKKKTAIGHQGFLSLRYTLIMSGLLLYASNSWGIRVYHAKNRFIFVSIKLKENFLSS